MYIDDFAHLSDGGHASGKLSQCQQARVIKIHQEPHLSDDRVTA